MVTVCNAQCPGARMGISGRGRRQQRHVTGGELGAGGRPIAANVLELRCCMLAAVV